MDSKDSKVFAVLYRWRGLLVVVNDTANTYASTELKVWPTAATNKKASCYSS